MEEISIFKYVDGNFKILPEEENKHGRTVYYVKIIGKKNARKIECRVVRKQEFCVDINDRKLTRVENEGMTKCSVIRKTKKGTEVIGVHYIRGIALINPSKKEIVLRKKLK